MKTIYCTEEHPFILIVEMEDNRHKTVTEDLFRQELQRLIDQAIEDGDNPVHQAEDQMRFGFGVLEWDLVEAMMREDCIYNLLSEVDGLKLIEAPEEIVEEYERRTFYSFLVEVMPDQNH